MTKTTKDVIFCLADHARKVLEKAEKEKGSFTDSIETCSTTDIKFCLAGSACRH